MPEMPPEDKPDMHVPSEFYFLAERKLAGTITAEEHARLEATLLRCPPAAKYYLSLCAVEAAAPDALRMFREQEAEREKTSAAGNVIRFRRRFFGVAAAAALLLVAITGYSFFEKTKTTAAEIGPKSIAAGAAEENAPLCRVALVLGASHGEKRIEPNLALGQETFAIDTGAVELVFRQGAHVLLEAPASLTITGANTCRLDYGKAVATVPDSAKGFIVETPKDRVVDYGTRFALDVSPDGERTRLGVLSGVVDIEHQNEKVRLFTDYAVERDGNGIASVPFARGDFLTEMPSQEYAWNLDGERFDKTHKLRFDVTRLIKTPGEIHVIFKTLRGINGINIKKITLERDGKPVMVSNIARRAGSKIIYTHDNFFPLELPANIPLAGKWELVAEAVCTRNTGKQAPDSTISSQGIFIFEKGAIDSSHPEDFIGRWQFSHDNKTYINEFLADGTVLMSINGTLRDFGTRLPKWTCENGIVTINFRRPGWVPLKLILRNKDTMIFLNQSYRNAQRME